jgi:tRNA G10  N-methylase Trm11
LVISNPPLGRRVRVPNMHGLFADLFRLSSEVLRPGGRLVFVNPLRLESVDPTLRLESRRPVDLGGYECRVEVYRKR